MVDIRWHRFRRGQMALLERLDAVSRWLPRLRGGQATQVGMASLTAFLVHLRRFLPEHLRLVDELLGIDAEERAQLEACVSCLERTLAAESRGEESVDAVTLRAGHVLERLCAHVVRTSSRAARILREEGAGLA